MIPMLPILLGSAMGALTSKKPLKGALLGAAGGALTGGMGGLLGGSAGSAAGAATGAAGEAAAAGGIEAMQAFNPITNTWQNPVGGGGLLSTLKDAAPVANAAMTGIQTAQSLMPQQQPIQAAPLQGGSFDASGLLSANNQQLQALQQKRQQRRGGV